jgi:hypothetical protein
VALPSKAAGHSARRVVIHPVAYVQGGNGQSRLGFCLDQSTLEPGQR